MKLKEKNGTLIQIKIDFVIIFFIHAYQVIQFTFLTFNSLKMSECHLGKRCIKKYVDLQKDCSVCKLICDSLDIKERGKGYDDVTRDCLNVANFDSGGDKLSAISVYTSIFMTETKEFDIKIEQINQELKKNDELICYSYYKNKENKSSLVFVTSFLGKIKFYYVKNENIEVEGAIKYISVKKVPGIVNDNKVSRKLFKLVQWHVNKKDKYAVFKNIFNFMKLDGRTFTDVYERKVCNYDKKYTPSLLMIIFKNYVNWYDDVSKVSHLPKSDTSQTEKEILDSEVNEVNFLLKYWSDGNSFYPRIMKIRKSDDIFKLIMKYQSEMRNNEVVIEAFRLFKELQKIYIITNFGKLFVVVGNKIEVFDANLDRSIGIDFIKTCDTNIEFKKAFENEIKSYKKYAINRLKSEITELEKQTN